MIFEGFTFGGGVSLGALAGFYGVAISEAQEEIPLAEFVGARLHGQPMLGDRVTWQDMDLTVQRPGGRTDHQDRPRAAAAGAACAYRLVTGSAARWRSIT